MQETLCPLQACDGDVRSYIARCFAVKKFNLRWTSHTPGSNQKAEWSALSSELLQILTSQRRNEFDDVITGDESRFYFEYPHAAV
jgi:hypothetical protein